MKKTLLFILLILSANIHSQYVNEIDINDNIPSIISTINEIIESNNRLTDTINKYKDLFVNLNNEDIPSYDTLIKDTTTTTRTGTSYYISNSGNDANTGLSHVQAWKTINKLNSETFAAGDSILFERGGLWNTSFRIPSSGNAENQITISNYGEGKLPRLYGSKIMDSYTSHPLLSNVYYCNDTINNNPHVYINPSRSDLGSIWFNVNDTIEWGDGITNYKTDISLLAANYDWTWQNDTIYFYSENINDIDSIYATKLQDVVIVDKDYITIDGLDVCYYGFRGIGSTDYPEKYRTNIIIRNCHIAYSGSKSTYRIAASGYGIFLSASNSILENNDIRGQGRRSISYNIQNGTNFTIRNVKIQDNHLYDGYHTTGIDLAIQGSTNRISDIHIRRNKIEEYYDEDKEVYTTQLIFAYNHGDQEDMDSIYIYNNQFINTVTAAIFMENIEGMFIVNNTFTSAQSGFNSFYYITANSGTVNLTSMNNIFFNHANTGYKIPIEGAGTLSPTFDTADYNLFYDVDITNFNSFIYHDIGANYRYTQWNDIQALGLEVNSPTPSFPCFIDSVSNLRLKSSSPAIGTGTPVSFITTDYDGNIRDSTNPSIGAFEFKE